jgi:hypothetical protein
VQLSDPVREAGGAQRQRREAEGAAAVGMGRQLGQLVTGEPRALGQRLRYRRARSGSKLSFPAGTGVCVVNTVEASTRSRASAASAPSATIARMRSSASSAECPSFMWYTVGRSPAAAGARTPPTPSRISWRIRISRSPP